jgi:transcription antitermination protein NusB
LGGYSRSRCREWALQFLYQAEFAGAGQPEAVERFWRHFQAEGNPPAYLAKLVAGVAGHLEELDAFIVRYSEHWRLSRMTIVDRNLLRLAIYELLYQPGIPPKVVINEAVEMAKRYGSEASGGFVNGILDQVRLSLGREV